MTAWNGLESEPARTFVSPAAKGTDEEGRAKVFLHPGHVYVAVGATTISSMVGSCVVVCLWDRKLRIGGAVHYLVPGKQDTLSGTSGVEGIRDLYDRMLVAGASPKNMTGQVFGGACLFQELRANQIGARNVNVARTSLGERHVPILKEDVGGERGRKVVFHTDTGEASVKTV